jgi:hypothetical protein
VIDHSFEFGQQVICDGHSDNPLTVVAVEYRPGTISFECAYWCNGDHKTVWVQSWRLTPKD